MKKILFNNMHKSENYLKHFEHLFSDYDLFRKKHYSSLCMDHLQSLYPRSSLLLTHSATGALEMIAHLIGIREGDEIIMPSFTFVSTANAFASHGATPVFVDIDPQTLNLDASLVEAEITGKTKAIIAVHYAGHPCDLEALSAICKKHNLYMIEDAAMGFGNDFAGTALGSYADFGVISFDITKHISAVQGGLLLVNNPGFSKRADDIYHIGTNRSAFMEGSKPYYEWVDVGSKFQMNELSAVVLYEYLLQSGKLMKQRNAFSRLYFENLKALADKDLFRLMDETDLQSNVHEFYLVLPDEATRQKLAGYLADLNIEALFHYIPLHNSDFGGKKGRSGDLKVTENISSRLLRLPLHTELTTDDIDYVCRHVKTFFHEKD